MAASCVHGLFFHVLSFQVFLYSQICVFSIPPYSSLQPVLFFRIRPLVWRLQSVLGPLRKYCHIIIHRMEGENLGEFGSGFNNSRYWLGQAFSYGQSEHPIFPQLRQDAEQLVGSCHDGKVLLRNMGPKWEPSLFNKLCEDALLTEDPEVLEFCKAVQTRELQLLFEHTMTQQQE